MAWTVVLLQGAVESVRRIRVSMCEILQGRTLWCRSGSIAGKRPSPTLTARAAAQLVAATAANAAASIATATAAAASGSRNAM